MAIAVEKIQKLREALDNIDRSVFKLTDIFFIDLYKAEINSDLLMTIQSYIVQMSLLIPEIRVYLNLVEIGVFDKFEFIIERFELMEEYVKDTTGYCEELLKELGLST